MSIPSLPRSVPADCHGLIRRAVEYWLSIPPAEGLPGRQHLDPSEIPELLANVRLVDVKGELPRFDIGDLGREHAVFFGDGAPGSRRREPFADFLGAPAESPFRTAVERKQPVWWRGAPRHSRNDERIPERVILPLSSNGRDVHMLFVVHVDH